MASIKEIKAINKKTAELLLEIKEGDAFNAAEKRILLGGLSNMARTLADSIDQDGFQICLFKRILHHAAEHDFDKVVKALDKQKPQSTMKANGEKNCKEAQANPGHR